MRQIVAPVTRLFVKSPQKTNNQFYKNLIKNRQKKPQQKTLGQGEVKLCCNLSRYFKPFIQSAICFMSSAGTCGIGGIGMYPGQLAGFGACTNSTICSAL